MLDMISPMPSEQVQVLDLFAGAGGVSLGLALLGIEDLGIELADDECATRNAAGFLTMQADVSALDPADFAGAEGLWDSSPCPDFSVLGSRAGRAGKSGWLVDEKLRWVKAIRPRWVACENVPPVLPIFAEQALELQAVGYKTWVGCLSTDEYGVPQTRNRAYLMASLDRPVAPPAPTHQPYEFGIAAQEIWTITGTLRPWVSMAEALGWPDDARAGFQRLDDTGTSESGYRDRDLRPTTDPAPTLAFGHDAAQWCWVRPATTIAGDQRVFQPGGHHEPGEQSENSIKLEPWEALLLMGMPLNHPLQGSRTAQFRQIGNGVCPPMAAAIVGELVGADWRAALDEVRGR